MGIFSALFGTNKSAQQTKSSQQKNMNQRKASVGTANAAASIRSWDHLENFNAGSVNLTVYDPAGVPLKLTSADQKNAGGEGIIYGVVGKPNFLIKIYKDDTLKNQAKMQEIRKRILDMVQMTKCAKMNFLAWPCMPVFNKQKEIIGFVMRKVEGRSFLSLRGPAIPRFYPGWDRSDLTRVALDYVKKLRELANNRVLVNDFNPSNFLVDSKGNVSFIDCDSYQIPSSKGGVHITKTFFPSHCAPELLQNKQLLEKSRNIKQVEFGAALTVFNILMLGLHPYNYYDPSNQSACGTPDENLLRGRCPLGRGSDCRFPQGNWFNLWSYLTGTLKGGFITTFKDGHSDPSKRISLDDLILELEKLLHEMGRNHDRCDLAPATRKPALNWDPNANRNNPRAKDESCTQKKSQAGWGG